ncbi:HIT domain-containing protein [Vreelandella zhaodongensis]|uniref:HIT domain-containing protein n=1 Tax=Vreelandella zhaodongensis TaxID=1176240 RepID=UPI003EBC954E
MKTFELDPRLEADTFPLCDLPLCSALMMNDARYPWVVLVPKAASVSEVFELNQDDQAQLWREAAALGATMKEAFHADKINIATLGNVVSQLHIHVVARYQDDASWPAPVWGNGTPKPYDLTRQGERRAQLLAQLEGLTL